MADKNIQMTQRNPSNTAWDNIYPITKVGNVQNIADVRIDSANKLRAEVKSSAPSNPQNGDIWYDSANHKFKGYANGAWV